ncbi:hypothetical protein [Alicyclobacillus ferrooxydans]|uniref:Uncharacterized protein n=1 Tax=Alicyclobacillus ferrooxydans TaxID=471514 RepID=A0A0P9CJ67_9BACL|nr:hypothetical protein [Alicyclobacillus ferrooxydans]KPV45697.1 hypothetical protein AN477_01985 [Alicyclobacillus ferrooxydans]
MSQEIGLLGTQPKQEQPDVQPCILPLVVLFSIAAQENRSGAGTRRVGSGYDAGPQGVPMARPGSGPWGPRARRVAPGVPMQGMNVRRRRFY